MGSGRDRITMASTRDIGTSRTIDLQRLRQVFAYAQSLCCSNSQSMDKTSTPPGNVSVKLFI